MGVSPDQPWVYPYVEDLTVGAKQRAARMGRVPLRPVVPVEMIGPDDSQRTLGLVDSGSEHTLAGAWLARATGARPGPDDPELEIVIGGRARLVRFMTVSLALMPPADVNAIPCVWEAQVGILETWEPPWPVLLGQVGFLDVFTVTMNRWARALTVESLEGWDERYPVIVEEPDSPWFFPY
jgi:hypothetical protein